ncbi:MAG: DUF4279 domain-containing protein [Candidatus Nitrotoga sp.]
MRITITLCFTGDLLDPEKITSILNVIPHVSRCKGDVRVLPTKKEIVSKFGLWEWRSKDASETLTINDHINRLKSTFEHVYNLFPNLPNVENTWVDICIVDSKGEGGDSSVSFLLDKESTVVLRDIGLPIEFTIYRSLPEASVA